MLKRNNYYIPTLLLLIILSVNVISSNQKIAVSLNKYEFNIGEPVYITIVNLSTDQIQFPNPQPYKIVNIKAGEVVYSPIVAQVIYTLGPRRSLTLVWNQTDNSGKQVAPGEYVVVVEYIGGTIKSEKFIIKESERTISEYITYTLLLLMIITVLVIIMKLAK